MGDEPDTGATAELQWKGRTGPFPLTLAPGVFVPTSTSMAMADCLEIHPGDVVADIGCGCGVLALVAARLGAARVLGTDISADAVRVASGNARALGLDDVAEFRVGHLFEPLAGVVADVVIGDVSGAPDALAVVAGWHPGGGPSGAETPVAMLESAGPHLAPGARLYLPTGSLHDEERVLAAAREVFGPDGMALLASRRFPLPGPVARSEAVAELAARGTVRLEPHGSRWLWTLNLWCCRRPGERLPAG